MRIGEVARDASVPPKTIRYYEAAGLLPPPRRLPNGYRDYDADAVERLRFIRAAQSVGLALGEVREILAFRDRGEPPCAHVADLIERRAAELDARIRDLRRMRRTLAGLARVARSAPPRPAAYCHVIEGLEPFTSG